MWIGHLRRNNTWVISINKGKIEGKLGKRRPRMSYIKKFVLNIG